MLDYSQLSDQDLLNEYLKKTQEKKNQLVFNSQTNLYSMITDKNDDEITQSVQNRLGLLEALIKRFNQESLPKIGQLSTLSEVQDKIKEYFHGLTYEKCLLVGINSQCQIIAEKLIAIGGPSAAVVSINRIVRWALEHHIKGLFMAHNHPNDDVKPSKDDLITSQQLQKALALIEVQLLDSMVIGNNHNYSMAKNKDIK